MAAAVIALAPLALIDELADQDVLRPELTRIAVYALGMAFLGFLDDMLGGEPRGWRGHGAAVAGGGVSTGALKAVGALGLACFALSGLGYTTTEYLLGVGLLILTTNLFNLLDLRPGRTGKAFVLLGAGLTLGVARRRPAVGARPVRRPRPRALGLRPARADHARRHRLEPHRRARRVLARAHALDHRGRQVAFAVVLVITIYGEFRSISSLIERAPLLRQLDSLGRPDHTHA